MRGACFPLIAAPARRVFHHPFERGSTPQRPERYKSNKRRECLTKVSSEERKADMVFKMPVEEFVLAANTFFLESGTAGDRNTL